jgi:hypothetical protein
LATITSASEQQFINRAFLIGRFEHAPVWIGLVRARTNATALTRVARALEDLGLPHSADPPPFKWVSKEPLAYSNWKPGEPNNFSGDENYVAINWQYSKDPPQGIQGDWNDAPLNGTTGFGGATDGPYFGLVERLTDPSQPPGIGTWPGPYRLLLIPAVLLAGGWAWRRLALKAKNGKSTPVKTAGGVD